MRLDQLTDIDYIDVDAEAVSGRLLNEYKRLTGRRLADGDPVRLFILTIAAEMTRLYNAINETGKQNLLAYAVGDNLEHIGALVGVERLTPVPATTTARFTLSAERGRETVIPKGTRITAGDNVFFSVKHDITILAGATVGEGVAQCLTVGASGNGYKVGELATIVDPVPYVESVTNLTTSAGGADRETDQSYRARIALAPEAFSVAGPTGAYEYYTKKANANIVDVAIVSPVPGDVVIYPLLAGGKLPETEVLKEVATVCNDKAVRPLTDHVTTKAPTAKTYNVNLRYYISADNAGEESDIKKAVTDAVTGYIDWQKARIGRDINPNELIARVMRAGAKRVEVTEPVYMVVKNGRQSEGYAVEVAVASGSPSVTYGGLEDE